MKVFEPVFVFLKGIAIIYFITFFSWFNQIPATLGYDGINPLDQTVKQLKQDRIDHFYPLYQHTKTITALLNWCSIRFVTYFAPTYDIYETLITTMCLLGMVIAIIMFTDRTYNFNLLFVGYFVLFFFHVHLVQAMGQFVQEQDYFLNEIGFIAPFILISTGKRQNKKGKIIHQLYQSPQSIISDLYIKASLFKLFFISGVYKLCLKQKSNKWINGSALSWYLYGQPMPNYASHWVHVYLSPQLINSLAMASIFVTIIGAILVTIRCRYINQIAIFANIIIQLVLYIIGNNGFSSILIIVTLLSQVDQEYYRVFMPNLIRKVIGIPLRTKTHKLTIIQKMFKAQIQIGIFCIILFFFMYNVSSFAKRQQQDSKLSLSKDTFKAIFTQYYLIEIVFVLMLISVFQAANKSYATIKKKQFQNKEVGNFLFSIVFGVLIVYLSYVNIHEDIQKIGTKKASNPILNFKHNIITNLRAKLKIYKIQNHYDSYSTLNSYGQRETKLLYVSQDMNNWTQVQLQQPRDEANYIDRNIFSVHIDRVQWLIYQTQTDSKEFIMLLQKLNLASVQLRNNLGIKSQERPKYVKIQPYVQFLTYKNSFKNSNEIWSGSNDNEIRSITYTSEDIEKAYRKNNLPADYKQRLEKQTHILQTLDIQQVLLAILLICSAYNLISAYKKQEAVTPIQTEK